MFFCRHGQLSGLNTLQLLPENQGKNLHFSPRWKPKKVNIQNWCLPEFIEEVEVVIGVSQLALPCSSLIEKKMKNYHL